MKDTGGVHNTLDEEHIIFGVVVIVEVWQLAELRAAWGHIHVRDGSLEAGALWCWFEGLDKVFAMILVHQDQGDFIVKWPLQQSIKFTLHQDEEDGEMCLVAHSIAI